MQVWPAFQACVRLASKATNAPIGRTQINIASMAKMFTFHQNDELIEQGKLALTAPRKILLITEQAVAEKGRSSPLSPPSGLGDYHGAGYIAERILRTPVFLSVTRGPLTALNLREDQSAPGYGSWRDPENVGRELLRLVDRFFKARHYRDPFLRHDIIRQIRDRLPNSRTGEDYLSCI